jgi:hypothetical protein
MERIGRPDPSIGRLTNWPQVALAVLGVASLAGYVALTSTLPAAGRRDIAAFIALYGLLFTLYLAMAVLILRGALSGRRALAIGLLMAVAFRLVMLPGLPQLSGDAYRYVWDARLLTHHLSPYLYLPVDTHLARLRDGLIYPHMGWYWEPTVYPPGAQYLYALVYLIAPDNVIAVKIALAACEAVGVAALIALLRARGEDPARALLYAWNPLAVVEVAGGGHIDAAAAAAIVLALLAERRGRHVLSGALLGLATLFKLFPLIVLAALDRRTWRRAVPAAGVVVALGYLPFLVTGAAPVGFLGKYVGDQEANQWLYVPASLAADAGHFALRHLLHLMPLLVLISVLAFLAWRRWTGSIDTVVAACWLLWAVLLLGPSMYPWYLLAVLPLLAVAACPVALRGIVVPGPPGVLAPLLLSATVMLSYALNSLTGRFWWLGVLEWSPAYLAIAAALVLFWRSPRWREIGRVVRYV